MCAPHRSHPSRNARHWQVFSSNLECPWSTSFLRSKYVGSFQGPNETCELDAELKECSVIWTYQKLLELRWNGSSSVGDVNVTNNEYQLWNGIRSRKIMQLCSFTSLGSRSYLPPWLLWVWWEEDAQHTEKKPQLFRQHTKCAIWQPSFGNHWHVTAVATEWINAKASCFMNVNKCW